MEHPAAEPALSPGDPRRTMLGRAVAWVLTAACLFVVYSLVAKQFTPISTHMPWRDDPYDAVVSFTVFFVPITVAAGLVRILRCRRDQPLPATRMLAVVRSARVIVAAMAATVISDWISVVLQANRAAWDNVTAVLVVLLVVVTLAVAVGGVGLHRAARRLPRHVLPGVAGGDWFGDLIAIADWISGWLGPLARMSRRVVRFVDRRVVGAIRMHPVTAAAAAGLVFGVLLALNTLLREGSGPALWLDVAVGGSGMFAFLVAAGAYVGLVRSERPATGMRRRSVDAAVIGCAAVPVALAFREWLWWVVGSNTGSAGRLGMLLIVAAATTALLVFTGETLLRTHRGTPA